MFARTLRVLLVLLLFLGYLSALPNLQVWLQKADAYLLETFTAQLRQSSNLLLPTPPPPSSLIIQINQNESEQYSAWPLQPVDLQLILQPLIKLKPQLLVIHLPCSWSELSPDSLLPLQQTLASFPKILWVSEGQDSLSPPTIAWLNADSIPYPSFPQVKGTATLPHLTHFFNKPHPALLPLGDWAIQTHSPNTSLPYAYQIQDKIVPSAIALIAANLKKISLAEHSINLSQPQGVYLQNSAFFPLSHPGNWPSLPTEPIPTLNALDIILSAATHQNSLYQNVPSPLKTIFLGLTNPSTPNLTTVLAQASTSIDQYRQFTPLPTLHNHISTSILIIYALWVALYCTRWTAPLYLFILLFSTYWFEVALLSQFNVWLKLSTGLAFCLCSLMITTLFGPFGRLTSSRRSTS